jgi:hypothetical protein
VWIIFSKPRLTPWFWTPCYRSANRATLGLGSALQIQSYRRRSFKAICWKKMQRNGGLSGEHWSTHKSLTRRQFFNVRANFATHATADCYQYHPDK